MKYQLSSDTWGQEELDAIQRVVKSNRFTMGPETKQFEKNFADWVGSKHAVMVNSGSTANLLVIASLITSGMLNKGDEVIVPAVSWSTSYFPLQQYGLKLRFVDIDINTLNYNIDKLVEAVTPNTKAILVVNLLGNSNDFDSINTIAKERELIIIEDNCESHGAEYNNKKTGTIGMLGTYSFFFSHHMSTMEGGMVVTDNTDLYHYLLPLRSHGWTRDLPDETSFHKKSDNSFYESFNFVLPGYTVRPTEIQAAVGIEQLKKVDDFVIQRRKNAEYFRSLFSNSDFFLQQELGRSSWFGFSLVCKEPNKRDGYIKKLHEAGVEVRPIVAGNFTKNPVISYFDYRIHDELVNADYIHNNGFFVGNSHEDISDKIDYLYETIGA